MLNIGRCPPKRDVEERAGSMTCGVPPAGRAVIRDSDEGSTHAKCSAANGFHDLGGCRIS
jgi:hypothetical protein